MSYRAEVEFPTTHEWMINGDTGLSSESLLATGLKIEKKGSLRGYQTPSDPSDLNRCIIFVDNFPDIAEAAFKVYMQKEGALKVFAENYQILKAIFVDEVGYNWSEGKRAPKTYSKMKELGL